jgi:hypothetical protein
MCFVWCLPGALHNYWCKPPTNRQASDFEPITITASDGLVPLQVGMILRQKGINPTILLIDKIVVLSIILSL